MSLHPWYACLDTLCISSHIWSLKELMLTLLPIQNIAGNECCERLAYYGMSTNLVNYLVERFNQGNATAANNVTNWAGTCYVTPLIGAFLADAYLGRFWVIAVFSTVYFIVS